MKLTEREGLWSYSPRSLHGPGGWGGAMRYDGSSKLP
jgi:hypothetical protein